jgi:hypothetical protein
VNGSTLALVLASPRTASCSISTPYPDVLLFDAGARALWCVEAVTSDGEADQHKVDNLRRLCDRSGVTFAGVTTAYRTWRDASRRQSKQKNLAPETCLWIQETGGIQFRVLPPVSYRARPSG